jgi:hypothetical protein
MGTGENNPDRVFLPPTSRSTAATVMALVEKTFSHSLNGWLLVTNRDFRS